MEEQVELRAVRHKTLGERPRGRVRRGMAEVGRRQSWRHIPIDGRSWVFAFFPSQQFWVDLPRAGYSSLVSVEHGDEVYGNLANDSDLPFWMAMTSATVLLTTHENIHRSESPLRFE